MAETRGEALAGLVSRLVEALGRDPAVRSGLRALAEIVLEATAPAAAPVGDDGEPPMAAPEAEDRPVANGAPSPAVPVVDRPEATTRDPLPALTLGSSPPASPTITASRPMFAGTPLGDAMETVAARCRLKAEATRWAVERRKRIDRGEDFRDEVAPRDHSLVDAARGLPECFLWMNQPYATAVSGNEAGAEVLASAFEVAAVAAEMLGQVEALPGRIEGDRGAAVNLVAEAQSGLRVIVERLGGKKDRDQVALYESLRELGRERNFYIERFMRLEDPADPARLPEVRRRMSEMLGKLDAARGEARRRGSTLNQIRYHARCTSNLHDGDYHWRKIEAEVDRMVQDGDLAPSSVDLRNILLPILDHLPDWEEVRPGFDRALQAIELYTEGLEDIGDASGAGPTPEVLQARELLRGQVVVLIGGTPRPQARDALVSALELKGVDWIVSRDHQSIAGFETHVARPDVRVVLLAIRWSNHSFEDVKVFCQKHGKVFVRLTSGYGPNQVAAQILGQASERLRRED